MSDFEVARDDIDRQYCVLIHEENACKEPRFNNLVANLNPRTDRTGLRPVFQLCENVMNWVLKMITHSTGNQGPFS